MAVAIRWLVHGCALPARSIVRVRAIVSRGGVEAADVAFRHPWSFGPRSFKRALDLLIAPAALVLLAPILLVAVVAIALDSPGGVVLRQRRVGLDGRPFELLKLRTMTPRNDDAEHRSYVASLIRGDAPAQDGIHKLVGDRRVTRVGRILRRFSVDEIPQLLNVIRGDMSLVGPRPALPHEVQLYDIRAWQRLRVRPGLSGLWQVSGRNRLDFWQMVELDVRYWSEWSAWLELGILLRTPWIVLSGRGAA